MTRSSHDQRVIIRPCKLKICQRIYTDRVGRLPCKISEGLNRAKGFSGEDITTLGREDEHNVVVLRVRILKNLKGRKLGIFFAKKDAIVGRELQISRPTSCKGNDDDRSGQDPKTPPNNPPGKCYSHGAVIASSELKFQWSPVVIGWWARSPYATGQKPATNQYTTDAMLTALRLSLCPCNVITRRATSNLPRTRKTKAYGSYREAEER